MSHTWWLKQRHLCRYRPKHSQWQRLGIRLIQLSKQKKRRREIIQLSTTVEWIAQMILEVCGVLGKEGRNAWHFKTAIESDCCQTTRLLIGRGLCSVSLVRQNIPCSIITLSATLSNDNRNRISDTLVARERDSKQWFLQNWEWVLGCLLITYCVLW